jgi:hypothetical protein
MGREKPLLREREVKAYSANFATVIALDSFKTFEIMTITLLDGTVIRLSSSDIPYVWVKDMAGGGTVAHEFLSAASSVGVP